MVYYERVPKETRHMKRGEGKTQTSISLREDLLAKAKEEAASEGRTLSNWIEQMLREKFPEVEETAKEPPAKKAAKKGKTK
jgi:hypothetical protein